MANQVLKLITEDCKFFLLISLHIERTEAESHLAKVLNEKS